MPLSTINVDLMAMQREEVPHLLAALRVLSRMLCEEHAEDYVYAAARPLGECIEEPDRDVWEVRVRRLHSDALHEWKATCPRGRCGSVHVLDHVGRPWTIE